MRVIECARRSPMTTATSRAKWDQDPFDLAREARLSLIGVVRSSVICTRPAWQHAPRRQTWGLPRLMRRLSGSRFRQPKRNPRAEAAAERPRAMKLSSETRGSERQVPAKKIASHWVLAEG